MKRNLLMLGTAGLCTPGLFRSSLFITDGSDGGGSNTVTYADDDMSTEAVAWRASQAAEQLAKGAENLANAADGLNAPGSAVAGAASDAGAQADTSVDQPESVLQQVGVAVSGLVNQTLSLSTPQIVTLVGMLAGAIVPGASLLGLSIAQITGIASGVAKAVPEAVAAFEEIKQVAASGLPPTPEQWASWNAAADQAHADFNAAADAVINGTGS